MSSQMLAGLKKTIPNAFRAVLLLEQAQRSVESRSSDQQAKIRQVVEASEGWFVRVRVDSPEPRELVLNEIEVFAAK